MADITNRPWGSYATLHHSKEDGFLLKRISVAPGRRLSLQSHQHRSEFWTVIKGCGEVTVGADVLMVGPRSSVYIPCQAKHRIENTHITDELVFVEVQVGDILEETDIQRYEDDYGRVADFTTTPIKEEA